jgi:hypothetical protein
VIVDWVKLKVVEYALSLVVAPLAMLTMQGLKFGVRQVDALPSWQKRAVVVAVAAMFTSLWHLAGVDFGVSNESIEGLTTLPVATLETALAAVLAMGLHWVKTMRQSKANGGK